MKPAVFSSYQQYQPLSLGKPVALAIGNFDGVHLGHQQLLATLHGQAFTLGGDATLLTFRPHPVVALGRKEQPFLTSEQELIRLLGLLGVDSVIMQPFHGAFAAMDPDRFFLEVVLGALGAGVVVVGENFQFGRHRAGRVELLEELGTRHGVRIIVAPLVRIDAEVVSSTRIRRLLSQGEVEAAARCLGRPFRLTGKVQRGAGRGRGLGFPTANLDLGGQLLPEPGVYAGMGAVVESGATPLIPPMEGPSCHDDDPARPEPQHPEQQRLVVVSVGRNRTFGLEDLSVEAHFPGKDLGNLYGRTVWVDLAIRLRDQKTFPNPETLIAQIQADIAQATTRLGAHPNSLSSSSPLARTPAPTLARDGATPPQVPSDDSQSIEAAEGGVVVRP